MLSIGSCTSTGNLPSSTWSSSACWISTRENPIFTNMLCNTAIAVMTRIAVARLTVNGQHAIRMSRSKSHSLHTFTAMHYLCKWIHVTILLIQSQIRPFYIQYKYFIISTIRTKLVVSKPSTLPASECILDSLSALLWATLNAISCSVIGFLTVVIKYCPSA